MGGSFSCLVEARCRMEEARTVLQVSEARCCIVEAHGVLAFLPSHCSSDQKLNKS